MRSIIILGTGRSGTSMVAATFRSSGAFMGDHLLSATPSNPHGYYEDREVNFLNDDLIQRLLGTPFLGWRVRNKLFRTIHTVRSAFFLAAPAKVRDIKPTPQESDKIRSFTQHVPFCYKDPRFSVTLPMWIPYLPADTGFVVVFRDPMRTVDSMLRDAKEQYEPPLPLTRDVGFQSWLRTYTHLLWLAGSSPNWHFVNYDSMLDGSAFASLDNFVGVTLDFSQIDAKTSRSSTHEWPSSKAANSCREIYERLCKRAAGPK